jgi:hypothetical protein
MKVVSFLEQATMLEAKANEPPLGLREVVGGVVVDVFRYPESIRIGCHQPMDSVRFAFDHDVLLLGNVGQTGAQDPRRLFAWPAVEDCGSEGRDIMHHNSGHKSADQEPEKEVDRDGDSGR